MVWTTARASFETGVSAKAFQISDWSPLPMISSTRARPSSSATTRGTKLQWVERNTRWLAWMMVGRGAP
jgi:hypothetical protein